MKVKVRFFTKLREITDKREEEIEVKFDSTLRNLLEMLEGKYGSKFRDYIRNKRGEFRSNLQYLINGKNAGLLEEFDTKLKEDDIMAIIPPVGGGSSLLQ